MKRRISIAAAVVLLLLLSLAQVYGLQTSLMPVPKAQFVDSVGKPLNGGKLYTCKVGTTCGPTTTTNLKTTYTDSTGLTANANPVVLDSSGRASVWLDGYYKMALYTSAGVLVWSVDNVLSAPGLSWGVDAAQYATLDDAVTAVGSTTATLLVSAPVSVVGNLTIPSNISLKVYNSGVISVATGKTLNINDRPIEAGLYKIFTLVGTGAVSGVKENNLVWFGGPADSATTDFVAAMKAAVSATSTGGVLTIPYSGANYYKYDNATNGLDDATIIDKAMTIRLEGTIKQTGYVYNSPAAKPAHIFKITGDDVTIEGNGTLQGPGTYSNVNGTYNLIPGLILASSADNVTIKGITIKDPPQSGINAFGCNNLEISGCKFTGGPLVGDAPNPGNFYIDLDGGNNNSIHANRFYMDSTKGASRQAVFAGRNTATPIGLSITDNKVYSVHSTAFYCYADYSNFSNNTITYNQATAAEIIGVAMKILGNYNTIASNAIYNAVQGGIRVDGASGAVITGNTVYNFGSVGIIVSDQNTNTTGLNYNIVSNNTLIGRTDGELVSEGIRYSGSVTLTTADCIGGKITNNTIINGGNGTYAYQAAIAVLHAKTGATYKMKYFDISGNTIIDRTSRYGIYVENLHYSKINDNLIKDCALATSMGIVYGNVYTGTNTFNEARNNIVRDDQVSPTLFRGVHFLSTNSTDNIAVGNRAHNASDANVWGNDATYRNVADRNLSDDTKGYIPALVTAEASANIEGDASTTIAVNVPTGAKIIGVQLRVDAALATGETWDAAFAGGCTTAIASAQAVAKNTKVNSLYNANAASPITTNTTTIAITKNGGGSFTAQGTIRALVYYERLTTLGDMP